MMIRDIAIAVVKAILTGLAKVGDSRPYYTSETDFAEYLRHVAIKKLYRRAWWEALYRWGRGHYGDI